jgi:cephalosporin-C deacetylase-like acetyl esterase
MKALAAGGPEMQTIAARRYRSTVRFLAATVASTILLWSPAGGRQETDVFSVLDRKPAPGPRITAYLEYQLDRAWQQDARRRARWAAVGTAEDLVRLQRETRHLLLDAIGGLPGTRTPLNVRTVGVIDMAGYRIEKVVFESVPGIHVPALVYVPADGPVPRPAVLVACGHSPEGKAFRNYQEICVRLARRGYIAICWDPIGQGERSQFWDQTRGRSRYNLVCAEHAVLGNLASLAGMNLARWEIWDGMRAVDFLLSRPDVDPKRISITGTSGGGFQAAHIGALDDRIHVVVPSCYITALPMRMANRIFEDPDSDPEQDPYRFVSAGVDHAGLLLLVHPRPLMIAAAVKDFVPIEGTRRTFRELRDIYRRFGAGDRVAMTEGFHEHRFSDENQDASFAFLDRFNALPERHLFEPVETLPAERLRSAPSGQVRIDYGGRSLMEVIRDEFRARRREPAPTLGDRYRGEAYPGIASWPVVARDAAVSSPVIAWELAGTARVGDVDVDRYLLRHSEALLMPLLHLHRRGAVPRATLLDISLEGKLDVRSWAQVARRIDEGYEIVSFDLRGVGETRMRYRAVSGDDPTVAPEGEEAAYGSPLSGVLANYVYNSLLIGRPYFLELIEDVEIAARFSRVKLGAQRIVASGRGDGHALAKAASEVLPGVEWLAESGVEPFRWSEAVESLRETWPISYLLPGGAYLK